MSADNTQNKSIWRNATPWLKDCALYLAALAAVLVAIENILPKLSAILQTSLQIGSSWVSAITWLILLAPLWVVFLCRTLPAVLKRRREQCLRLAGINGELSRHDYFRLTPFTCEDQAQFRRADHAHEKIEHWLRASHAPLLYVTGRSGVGKSSILQAWLIPRLQDAYCVLAVRTFSDPSTALRHALLDGDIFGQRKPPVDTPLYELLGKATRKIAPKRLLLVLDQFEEFLILHNDEQRAAFSHTLQQLLAQPLPALTLLAVFRSDYNGRVAELNLPPLHQQANWQEILPFTEAAARQFIHDSGLELDGELLEKILDELSELEDTAGLIRPISLNMVGLVLQRFAGGQLRGHEMGKLIRSYLCECLRHREVIDYAARLLEPMITAHGTKKPVSIAELAVHCRCDAKLLRGVLLRLQQQGLVRLLQPDVWEIAHDFVANQLGQLLPRLPKAKPWAMWTSGVVMGLWLAVFTVGDDLLNMVVLSTQKKLENSGLSFRELKDQVGYEVRIVELPNSDFSEFWQQFDWLQWHQPILRLLIASNDNLQNLPVLNNLPQLQTLQIGGSDSWFSRLLTIFSGNVAIAGNKKLQTLPTLDKLLQLQTLEIIDNNNLQTLPALNNLPQLQTLRISLNKNLQTLPALDNLPKLEKVDVQKNGKTFDLSAFSHLPQLRQLCVDEFYLDDDIKTFQQKRQQAGLPEVKVELNCFW